MIIDKDVPDGRKLKRNVQVIFFIVVALWSFSSICPQRARAASLPRTSIIHEPGLLFKTDEGLALDVFVTDPAGVEEVRCYFRFDDSLPYIFMKMQKNGDGSFHGALPPPADHIEEIEYLFLAINGERQAIISKSHRAKKPAGTQKSLADTGAEDAGGELYLETDASLSQVKETFAESGSHVTFALVEKARRFGIIAGLYTVPQIGTEVVEGYFGAFRFDAEMGMIAVKGYAVDDGAFAATSTQSHSRISTTGDIDGSDAESENGSAPPSLAGSNWRGEFYRSDDKAGTVIPLRAEITQVYDEKNKRWKITITTTKEDIGHHLSGRIWDDGDMLLYDSFDNEDWTTYYGPASELYIKIADFIRPPTPSDPSPPLNIIELTRESVVEPVVIEPILHLLLGK